MRLNGLEDTRWPAALDLVLSGLGTIQLGGLASITWWTQGVGADPRVHIDIFCDGDPRFIPRVRAEKEIAEGVALVRSAAAKHRRLGRLLDDEVVVWQYVYDYGKGSVLIAEVGSDGTISWNKHLRGVERGSRPEDG